MAPEGMSDVEENATPAEHEEVETKGEGGQEDADGAEFDRRWDDGQESYYFYHWTTGESYWPISADEDEQWVEITDEASGYRYHMHAETHETYWAEDNERDWQGGGEDAATTWEELKDPITGVHYYYSNVNGGSQWAPPPWVDYVDQESGTVYYLDTKSGESTWEIPEGFVDEAVNDTDTFSFPGQGRGTGDFGASYGAPAAAEVLESVPEEEGSRGGDAMEVAPHCVFTVEPPLPPPVASDGEYLPTPPPPTLSNNTSTMRNSSAESAAAVPGLPAFDSLPTPTPRLVPAPASASAPAEGAKQPDDDLLPPTSPASSSFSSFPPSHGDTPVDSEAGPADKSASEAGGDGGGGCGATEVPVKYSLSKRPRGKQTGLSAYPLNSGALLSPQTPHERSQWREKQQQQQQQHEREHQDGRSLGLPRSSYGAPQEGGCGNAMAHSAVATAYLTAVRNENVAEPIFQQVPAELVAATQAPPLMPPPPPGPGDHR